MKNSPSARELLQAGASALGLSIPSELLPLFGRYYDELAFWNRIAGITSYRKEKDVLIYMFLDSMAGVKVLDGVPGSLLLDVGTGGGFPGLPMKMLRPAVNLVLLDSSEKKVRFLEHLVRELALDGVTVLRGRIQKLAESSPYREKFDVMCIRALAPLKELVEMVFPCLSVGGHALAWKGPSVREEIHEAKGICVEVGAQWGGIFSYRLPFVDEERHIVAIKKVRTTAETLLGKRRKPQKH